MNVEKPLIFVSPIKKKSVIKSGYHGYSHKCGILLLEKAFSYIGLDFSQNDIVKAENGKPYIKDNPVYSKAPVGVDCESVRRASGAVMKRCYGDSEANHILTSADSDKAFSRLWTLKESYAKMTGEGVGSDLKMKCFDEENGRTIFESGAVFYHYGTRFNNEDYYISVCVKTDDKKSVDIIKKVDFDIDNEHILLYNVSDN